MGVTPQAVGQWEKSNPQFTLAKTNIIANLLEVDFSWLEGDIGTDDEIIFMNKQDSLAIAVPFVNKLEALSFSIFSIARGEPEDFKKGMIVPTGRLIGRGFAFEMDDDSMFPMIQKEDILIFDPAINPQNDDIVFAITYEHGGMINPIIRLYSQIGEDAHGNLKIRLEAINESVPSVTLNDGAIGQTFAVLVELRMIRPKGARMRA